MAERETETCDVLVIECSMISLSMAALLAEQDIRCIAVERHETTAIHPRSAMFQPRTVQLFERMGLYDDMKAEADKYSDEKVAIVDVETLSGILIQKWTAHANEGIERISPVPRMFLSQKAFEPIIKEHATRQGADVRFGVEMIAFVQEPDGVLATMRRLHGGSEFTVKAKYMVACDGHRSPIRDSLCIPRQGYGLLSRCVTIYFQADLFKYIDGKYNGVIYVNNEHIRGVWRLDKTGKNGFMLVIHAGPRGSEESKHIGDTITEERAMRYLYDGLGVQDVPFKITYIDKWDAVCDVAMDFRRDRIFIMGDAAHTVTPHGGFGGNAGVQDAQNLSWKLALVLKGKAGPKLLDTYQQERFPICKKTVDQVFCRYISRSAPELRVQNLEKENEVPEPWLELGYNYLQSDAIIYESPHDDLVENPETAICRPGTMAHHVEVTPLEHKSLSSSVPVLKLLSNTRFVLLLGEDAAEWNSITRQLLIDTPDEPLKIYRVRGDEFFKKYGISSSGAVLVRPDAFIAWRSRDSPQSEGLNILKRVIDQILQRL